MTKLFLELEFQHKGNKQAKKGDFSADSRFSRQDWIQKIKLRKCYTEKDKNKKFDRLLGQEPTFNVLSKAYKTLMNITLDNFEKN